MAAARVQLIWALTFFKWGRLTLNQNEEFYMVIESPKDVHLPLWVSC